jgi:hypothetical protein
MPVLVFLHHGVDDPPAVFIGLAAVYVSSSSPPSTSRLPVNPVPDSADTKR